MAQACRIVACHADASCALHLEDGTLAISACYLIDLAVVERLQRAQDLPDWKTSPRAPAGRRSFARFLRRTRRDEHLTLHHSLEKGICALQHLCGVGALLTSI